MPASISDRLSHPIRPSATTPAPPSAHHPINALPVSAIGSALKPGASMATTAALRQRLVSGFVLAPPCTALTSHQQQWIGNGLFLRYDIDRSYTALCSPTSPLFGTAPFLR